LFLGGLLCPLVAPVAAWLTASLADPPLTYLGFPVLAYFTLSAAYIGVLLVGLPVMLALRRFGRLSVTAVLACAIGMSLPYWALLHFFPANPQHPEPVGRTVALLTIVTVAVGLAWCLVSGIPLRSKRRVAPPASGAGPSA
jgi:hypothetical protein